MIRKIVNTVSLIADLTPGAFLILGGIALVVGDMTHTLW